MLHHSDEEGHKVDRRATNNWSPSPEDRRHRYRTQPAENAEAPWGVSEAIAAAAPSLVALDRGVGRRQEEGGASARDRLQEIPPHFSGGDGTRPGSSMPPATSALPAGSGGGDSRRREGLFDVLRPFYSSLRLW